MIISFLILTTSQAFYKILLANKITLKSVVYNTRSSEHSKLCNKPIGGKYNDIRWIHYIYNNTVETLENILIYLV